MRVRARAPGKLVVLGEYAVLQGAPALVFAVDRYCVAEVGTSPDAGCHLEALSGGSVCTHFGVGEPSGSELVDLVLAQAALPAPAPWAARLDSQDFFESSRKLGLGSSAAALTAFAAAWWRYASGGAGPARPGLADLIEWHRRFQGGRGSGLDVAASVTGGAVRFESEPGGQPCVSSVPVPISVRFAGVFTGRSAATPGLIGAFDRWRMAVPDAARQRLSRLSRLAAEGMEALGRGDVEVFLDSVTAYGELLADLGRQMDRDVVTAEHREVAAEARRIGVCYKISGAGGGDLGIALTTDPDALAALAARVNAMGYRFVDLNLDQEGLSVVEMAGD